MPPETEGGEGEEAVLTAILYNPPTGFIGEVSSTKAKIQREILSPIAAVSPNSKAILWIHGGNWEAGPTVENGFEDVRECEYLAEHTGYAVFNMNYPESLDAGNNRFKNIGAFPVQVEAATRAFEWIRAHAATYNVNPEKIIVVGGSTGANISLLTALSINTAHPGRVIGCAAFSGPTNLLSFSIFQSERREERWKWEENGKPAGGLIGPLGNGWEKLNYISVPIGYACGATNDGKGKGGVRTIGEMPTATHPTAVPSAKNSVDPRSWSPVLIMSSKMPPTWIYGGEKEQIVPFFQQEELVTALETAKVPHVIRPMPGAGHSIQTFSVWRGELISWMEGL